MTDLDQLIQSKIGYINDANLPMCLMDTFTRADLFAFIGRETQLKIGAEIGVWNGVHAESLFSLIPNLKLYAVDSWCSFKQGKIYTDEELNGLYEEAKANLFGTNSELMRMSSFEASRNIENDSLDFVYIDAGHYFNDIMLDLLLWAPKVRKGGIVAGHDFRDLYTCGVVDAVKAYTQANRISEWYITFEEFPSWFWVKG